MKLFFYKDTLKKFTGIIIAFSGLLLLVVALYGFVTGIEENSSEDIVIACIVGGFSAALIIPGSLLYRSGVKLSKLERKLKQLAALVETYRRISVSEIAKKMGVTESEAENLITTAVGLGLFKGNMDRATGEFFLAGSLDEIRQISFCPNCGASVSQVIHRGETGKCTACGSLFN
jgi:uncharacterized membrane protein YciS (DUF1049 family)